MPKELRMMEDGQLPKSETPEEVSDTSESTEYRTGFAVGLPTSDIPFMKAWRQMVIDPSLPELPPWAHGVVREYCKKTWEIAKNQDDE